MAAQMLPKGVEPRGMGYSRWGWIKKNSEGGRKMLFFMSNGRFKI